MAGTSFKIADLDWASINYSLGDIMIPFEEPIEWMYGGSNNDTVVEEDYEGTIHLDLSNGTRQPAMVTVYPGLSPGEPLLPVLKASLSTKTLPPNTSTFRAYA